MVLRKIRVSWCTESESCEEPSFHGGLTGFHTERLLQKSRPSQCRHPLQAHQIQGSDFPALYPVVTWLVHKFYGHREATAAQLRKFAELKFEKVRY